MDIPSNSSHPKKKLPLEHAARAALWLFAELHMQAAVRKKPPTSGRREKSKTSYGFSTIALLRLLFHSSSNCIKLVSRSSAQMILEADFDSHNSHWKVFICA